MWTTYPEHDITFPMLIDVNDDRPKMKNCTKCGSMFETMRCPACQKIRSARHYLANSAEYKTRSLKYRTDNPEKEKARHQKRYAENPLQFRDQSRRWAKTYPDRFRDIRRDWEIRNPGATKAARAAWKRNNPDRVNAVTAKRRATKLEATPAWAIEFFIREAYALAKLREKTCGGEWHVDHIVPLRSKLVCGLHTHHNLQVIPAKSNISKNNRFWPDMP